MTTLNEKAMEYLSEKCGLTPKDNYYTNIQNAYIAGATEATRWRDVNVELPEDNQSLIRESTLTVLKGRKLGTVQTNKILVKYRNGDIDISTRCKCNGDNYYWWSAHESFESNNDYNIVAWRPIETI